MHVPKFLFFIIPTNYDSNTHIAAEQRQHSLIFYDRWLVPPYPRVLNLAKFCKRKDDVNLIYGLSLEGIDPVVLRTDKLISDIDWLSIS